MSVTAVISEDISRATFDKSNCKCESCKLERYGRETPWNPGGSKLGTLTVRDYSYRPRNGWSLKSVKNDTFSYYLGVELETDNYGPATMPGGGLNFSSVSQETAAAMAMPKVLWVAKHDGSVSGPEFVSMPATLTYWQRQREKLDEMFRMLLHAGYRSHDNDNCGMHINISRSAFDSADHLYRFLTIIHGSPAWSLRMSQRTAESAERWAKLEKLRDQRERRETAESYVPQTRETYYGERVIYPGAWDRYVALNAPNGQPRYEFRLPRGTLRVDRFFKNLEWTVAMTEYSRTCTDAQARSSLFMRWVEENRAQYPDLFNFMVERRLHAVAK